MCRCMCMTVMPAKIPWHTVASWLYTSHRAQTMRTRVQRPCQPLPCAVQILEDVSEEHARKTITVDPFPHSGVPAASIHPCKHASVMKKLGNMAEASGHPFRVDRYGSSEARHKCSCSSPSMPWMQCLSNSYPACLT